MSVGLFSRTRRPLRVGANIVRIFFLTGLAMGLAVTTPAVAQHEARDYGRPEPTPENLASMALRGSSYCAAQQAQATAREVLTAPLASSDEAKYVKALHMVARSCYKPNWPDFPPTAVRNALAEMAYREENRTPPKPVAAGTPPPESFAVVPADTHGTDQQEAAWYLGALANCVVFTDNAGAHEFVTGPANVAEEERRFAALAPALARCVPPGSTKLTARAFRGFVANALLDQSHAARK